MNTTLLQLGWKPHFQQQLSLEDLENCAIYRVFAQHRSQIVCLGSEHYPHPKTFQVTHHFNDITVGDWVLIDSNNQIVKRLDRFSLAQRKAAGTEIKTQRIAANVDTIFIVMSLNQDFNLNRLERYLALVKSMQVEPVVILTKADLCENYDDFAAQVQRLDPFLTFEIVNALDNKSVQALQKYSQTGNTVAFIGSSGVGKSTLVNSLSGNEIQKTGSIREDDDKGRHTTTSRQMQLLPNGALLLDTPGMRELQLVNSAEGIADTFNDIEQLASECRFHDCQHESEPGCAIQAAIVDEKLDVRRLRNYQKLLKEDLHNTSTVHERRQADKKLHKFYKTTQQGKYDLKYKD